MDSLPRNSLLTSQASDVALLKRDVEFVMEELIALPPSVEAKDLQQTISTILKNVFRLVEATIFIGDKQEKIMAALNEIAGLTEKAALEAFAGTEKTSGPRRQEFEDDPGLIVGDDLDK